MILSDIPGTPGHFWGDHTTYVGPYKPSARLTRWLGTRWAYNLIGIVAALRMFLRRHRCQGLVTSGGACGLMFAWLQALVPWGRKPHVMIDCLWSLPESRLARALKALQLRLAARSVHRFVVWARHEADDFARAFGLPPDRFAYVPFHHTLDDYEYRVEDGGYLFAGGNSDRDYRVLVEAVFPLKVPTWIATTRRDLLGGMRLPGHVRVEPTSDAGFRQAMASARLVVIPMQGGLLRSAGQQTLLNALVMGKPTVAVGRRWASDLMTDGEHGLIVDYGDADGLRRAVEWIAQHPAEAQQMALRGRAHARELTTRRTMETIYDLVTGAGDGEPAAVAVPAASCR
jgi:Glycosyl transferases group 1